MTDRDAISAQYFNQANITLEAGAGIDPDMFAILADGGALARLTGAPDGSHVTMARLRPADALHLCVHNLAVFRYPSEYVLFNDGERLGLTMRVDSIYVRETLQGKGIGPRSVMLSLREAKALNFGFVSLEAAGSATNRSMFFGYHVWPSMGFDAILPTEKKRLLPAGLAHAERLSDLMLTEEGVEWWYARGGPIELDFDLADDSISWQLCRRYAEMKGIRI